MRQGVIVGAFALVSAVALAGWVRKPEAPAPAYPATAYAPAPAPVVPIYPQQAYPVQAYAPAPYATTAVYQRPVARRAAYVAPRRVVQKRKRPFAHSAAIVGGSAGAGAAIGALAGGGKGAGIGALAGGAAGLVYDRLTHKK
jgi:uncharacterized protein YcfJ